MNVIRVVAVVHGGDVDKVREAVTRALPVGSAVEVRQVVCTCPVSMQEWVQRGLSSRPQLPCEVHG